MFDDRALQDTRPENRAITAPSKHEHLQSHGSKNLRKRQRLSCCWTEPNIVLKTTMSAGPEKKELKAQWKTETEVPTLSLSDVAKHKSKTDNWIVIHGHGTDTCSSLGIVKFADEG